MRVVVGLIPENGVTMGTIDGLHCQVIGCSSIEQQEPVLFLKSSSTAPLFSLVNKCHAFRIHCQSNVTV